MTFSPATLLLQRQSKSSPHPDGGNLAFSMRHFLFVSEQFKKLLGQITDTAGRFRSVPAGSASAVPPHGSSRHVPQTLPFVFPEVNHNTHTVLLSKPTVRGGLSQMQEGLSP